MGRIMAFDYGSKRVGVAVTDPLQMIAHGLTTVRSNEILEYINKYLESEKVDCFVVGEPKQNNNTPSDSAENVKKFVTNLKKRFPSVQISMVDERFTSKLASMAILSSGIRKMDRQNKALIDEVSATIILQSYLENQNSKNLL